MSDACRGWGQRYSPDETGTGSRLSNMRGSSGIWAALGLLREAFGPLRNKDDLR